MTQTYEIEAANRTTCSFCTPALVSFSGFERFTSRSTVALRAPLSPSKSCFNTTVKPLNNDDVIRSCREIIFLSFIFTFPLTVNDI